MKNRVLKTTAAIAGIMATVTAGRIDCNKPANTATLAVCVIYLAILVYANFDKDGNRCYSDRKEESAS